MGYSHKVRHLPRQACTAGACAAVTLAGGCSLAPKETAAERDRLNAVATEHGFETPLSERALPELSAAPTWRDALHRTFLASGDLEAAYFEWKAALERVDMASAWPNTNVALGYDYMFSSESMKAFDRMTFSAGFDAMENLQLPVTVEQAGRVALAEAKATGERFRAAKFALQRDLLRDWAELALLERRIALAEDDRSLLVAAREAAQARLVAGGSQRDALWAEVALRQAENSLESLKADRAAMAARLNAMLAQPADAPLAAERLEAIARDVPSDAALLETGIERNPQLAALARLTDGRTDALELARLQWVPDISPALAFTGSASQAIGAMITLPTTIAEIKGSIREGQAMLRAAQAMREQTRRDQTAELIAAIVALRNQQRQARFEIEQIIPAAQQLAAVAGEQYSAGAGEFNAVIEARRLLLEARVLEAEAIAGVAQSLAEIENLLGVDLETLMPDKTPHASSQPDLELEHEHD